MDDATLRAFREFHRVVKSMESTELWRDDLLRVGAAVSFGGGVHVEKDFPPEEKFRSLMMDFRQLLSNNDPSNFNYVCNRVILNQGRDGWSQEDIESVKSTRHRFHGALEQEADFFSLPDGAARPTVAKLLDGWLNGEWFHGDHEKREERQGYELVPEENLSLALVIPAVRVAIEASIDLDALLVKQFGAILR